MYKQDKTIKSKREKRKGRRESGVIALVREGEMIYKAFKCGIFSLTANNYSDNQNNQNNQNNQRDQAIIISIFHQN